MESSVWKFDEWEPYMKRSTSSCAWTERLPAIGHAVARLDLAAFLLVVSAAALALRYINLPFTSADYSYYLSKWYADLQAAGGFAGIGQVYGNYTPAYMYLMALMTHLPLTDVVAIKLFSIVFDYVLAVFVGLTVLHITRSKPSALMAYTATLFLPGVFINSALWGQCDSIFTAFLIMSLYFLLKERSVASMLCFGLAFSFKLQAIFFLPIVIIALCKRKLKWWSPLLAVAVFLASGLPAILAGMSPGDAYGVYFVQASYYEKLSMNAPSLYEAIQQLMTYAPYEGFDSSLVWFAFGATGCAMLPLYRKRFPIEDSMVWLLAALFFAAFMPFVLPHMHERYWYFADILAVILVICRPRMWYAALLLMIPSLYAVAVYIFRVENRYLPAFALVMLVGICAVGYLLWKQTDLAPESPRPTA